MCGRAACGLDPDTICNACGYKTKEDGKWTRPQWKQSPGSGSNSDGKGPAYYPSYNMCPGSYLPVLVSKEHFPELCTNTETEYTETKILSETVQCSWVVMPMQWGLVPSWHTGDPKSIMYNMINARSEGMLSKRTFKTPLEKGRRCVILVEGYYEWQKTKDGKKQPHFFYFPPAPDAMVVKVNQLSRENQTPDAPETEWTGQRILTLAGLFDVWRPKGSGLPVYSCSIITVDAHEKMQWVHDRMPAVLNGEEEVKEWLDHASVPVEDATKKLIRPVDCLQCHPVSTAINNNKNKSSDCVQPIDLEKIQLKQKASSNFMKAWLSGTCKRPVEDIKYEQTIKSEHFQAKQEDGRDDDGVSNSKVLKLEPTDE